MTFLYQDENYFAIDKAADHFVHPPERSPYPVHRLDAPTTGSCSLPSRRKAPGSSAARSTVA
jgi:23S rRNA-/tRNA-specific pseudouridylate synthase